jgi:hypothetical protein
MAIDNKPAPKEPARGSVPTQPGSMVQPAAVGGIAATAGASQVTSPNPVARGPAVGHQRDLATGHDDPLNIRGGGGPTQAGTVTAPVPKTTGTGPDPAARRPPTAGNAGAPTKRPSTVKPTTDRGGAGGMRPHE